MLSPGSWATVTGVTLEPAGFDVFPDRWSPLKEKSSATTDAAFLQAWPFILAEKIHKNGENTLTEVIIMQQDISTGIYLS